MAITLIPLDDDHEIDLPTVIVGKNILLKIRAKQSLAEKNKSLSTIINTEDLLQQTDLWNNIRSLKTISDEIEDEIGNSIRFRDYLAKLTQKTGISETFRQFLKEIKEKINEKIKEIGKIELSLGLSIAKDHAWNFCKECDACIGQHEQGLPSKCNACGTEIDKTPSSAFHIRILEKEVKNYLDGTWFEDYIAKIFKRMGWEAWSSGEIMGATGVYHQMDVLAIKKENGKVVIAECKRSAKADHAYRLITQFLDVQPECGLLISQNKVKSGAAINLLNKKPGLKLLELGEVSDEAVTKLIKDYTEREN